VQPYFDYNGPDDDRYFRNGMLEMSVGWGAMNGCYDEKSGIPYLEACAMYLTDEDIKMLESF
jgi:hypothetical protein